MFCLTRKTICSHLSTIIWHATLQRAKQKRMAPTFCSRCGDAIEEECVPWDELAELDALLERFTLRRYDIRKINRLSSIVRQLPPDVMSTIFEFCLPNFADHQLYPYPKENLSHCEPRSAAHVVKDYTNKAKTDMFLPLSDR